MQTGVTETLDEKAFFITINQVATSSLRTYGMTVNDIYEVSCDDVKKIARATEIEINDYVCGGIDELIGYINNQSLFINAIGSYDVIEHIYDIEDYLRKLRLLSSNKPFRVVLASGANIRNLYINRKLRKHHLKSEHEERKREWGHKERDSLKGHLSSRKKIIADYEPTLKPEVIKEIARKTRGLITVDIEKCVDEYKTNGSISYIPDGPTNTCDPYTGNWCEHLMKTEKLENILKHEGFNVKILCGYYRYNCNNSFQRRVLKNMLNAMIKMLGRNGLVISPYYVIYADYAPSSIV